MIKCVVCEKTTDRFNLAWIRVIHQIVGRPNVAGCFVHMCSWPCFIEYGRTQSTHAAVQIADYKKDGDSNGPASEDSGSGVEKTHG